MAFLEAPVNFPGTYRARWNSGLLPISNARDGRRKTWDYRHSTCSILLKARLSVATSVMLFKNIAKLNFEVIVVSRESNWQRSAFCLVRLLASDDQLPFIARFERQSLFAASCGVLSNSSFSSSLSHSINYFIQWLRSQPYRLERDVFDEIVVFAPNKKVRHCRPVIGSWRKPRRQEERVAVHVCYKSLYISWPSSEKKQLITIEFCVVQRTWSTMAIFYKIFISLCPRFNFVSFDTKKQRKMALGQVKKKKPRFSSGFL